MGLASIGKVVKAVKKVNKAKKAAKAAKVNKTVKRDRAGSTSTKKQTKDTNRSEMYKARGRTADTRRVIDESAAGKSDKALREERGGDYKGIVTGAKYKVKSDAKKTKKAVDKSPSRRDRGGDADRKAKTTQRRKNLAVKAAAGAGAAGATAVGVRNAVKRKKK